MLYDYASVSQFYWVAERDRHCQLSSSIFLRHSYDRDLPARFSVLSKSDAASCLPLLPSTPQRTSSGRVFDLCFSSFAIATVRRGVDHLLLLWFEVDVAKVAEQHSRSHARQRAERSRALETPPGQLLHSVCGETA